jgi:hypothetical protein
VIALHHRWTGPSPFDIANNGYEIALKAVPIKGLFVRRNFVEGRQMQTGEPLQAFDFI